MEERRTFQAVGLPYEIQYREEGIFLVFSANALAGESPLPPQLVLYDCNRRGITGVRQGELVIKLRQRLPEFPVAGAQEEKETDSAAYVAVSSDGMAATMWLLPPSGEGAMPDTADIFSQIEGEWGVTYGLDAAQVQSAILGRKWFEPVVIAEGLPPVNGEDGRLDILFETHHDNSPRELEDGSVDYKNLDLFASVAEGDLLARCIPPTPGEPGRTVQDKEIPPKPGKAAKMPRGRNVQISEDGCAMTALRNGRVDYLNGRVEVSDQYVIGGSVDMGVGNIDFQGDVLIRGGIIAGLTVMATGNIEVNETVENAVLIAGCDIILQKGIQGMDKALLQAGGNVISKFIERSVVEAGGNVHSDYIAHSNVTARGLVKLKGKHGRLIGGVARAGKELSAITLGTPTGEKTLIEVGAPPAMRKKQTELTETISGLKAQMDKIDSMTRIYGRKENTREKEEMWKRLMAGREQLQGEYDAASEELEQLRAEIDALTGGRVSVFHEAYHDVKITIDQVAYTVRDTMQHATFRCKGGEIVFGACEVYD